MKTSLQTIFWICIVFANSVTAQIQRDSKVDVKLQAETLTAANQNFEIKLEAGERFLNLSSLAFDANHKAYNNGNYLRGENMNPYTQSVYRAPIILPHGARITRIIMICYDDSEKFDVTLFLKSAKNYYPKSKRMGDSTLATLESSGKLADYQILRGRVNRTLDNLNYGYYLEAHIGREQRLRNVRVFYK